MYLQHLQLSLLRQLQMLQVHEKSCANVTQCKPGIKTSVVEIRILLLTSVEGVPEVLVEPPRLGAAPGPTAGTASKTAAAQT